MEKGKVLAKFFELSERLRAQKFEFKEKNKDTEFAKKLEGKRLSVSARQMLGLLYENGNLNQRSISKMMNISAQAVSETIKKLEMYELVNKVSGTQNNENIIVLTEFGKECGEKFGKRIREHSEQVFSNFTEEDLEKINELLDKLLQAN